MKKNFEEVDVVFEVLSDEDDVFLSKTDFGGDYDGTLFEDEW